MIRVAILVITALCVRPAWAAFRADRAFLSTDMQPAVVARTLSGVEDEWKARARAFIKCELAESKEASIRDCDDTPSDFSKSCSTVVGAVVQGSGGDPTVMKEYMGNVCNQDIMLSWHQASCISLANAIGMKMSASQYENRANFQTSAVCDNFWSTFLSEQKGLHEKELAAMKEQEKKAAETAVVEANAARVRAEKARKDLEEAEKGDSAKEEAELDVERTMVAKRVNVNRTSDRSLEEKEVEVEKVEETAAKKIEEATRLEEEPLTPADEDTAAKVVKAKVVHLTKHTKDISKPHRPQTATKGFVKKADGMKKVESVEESGTKWKLPAKL